MKGSLNIYVPSCSRSFSIRSTPVYLIETKGDDKVDDVNVRQKQMATIEWIKKINALDAGNRMNRTWEYVLVGECVFYSLSGSGATITDICNQCKVSYSVATGNLFE